MTYSCPDMVDIRKIHLIYVMSTWDFLFKPVFLGESI